MEELCVALKAAAQGPDYQRLEELQSALHLYLTPDTEELRVKDIRATHDNVQCHFRHGHIGQSLDQLVEDLRAGNIDVQTGGLVLEGAYYKGAFRCIGNRRTHCLWEAFGKNSEQPVQVKVFPLWRGGRGVCPILRTELGQEFLRKFFRSNTSTSDGRYLKVHGRAKLDLRQAPQPPHGPPPLEAGPVPPPILQAPAGPTGLAISAPPQPGPLGAAGPTRWVPRAPPRPSRAIRHPPGSELIPAAGPPTGLGPQPAWYLGPPVGALGTQPTLELVQLTLQAVEERQRLLAALEANTAALSNIAATRMQLTDGSA